MSDEPTGVMFTSTAMAPAAAEDPARVRRPAPAVGPQHHRQPEAAQPDRDIHDDVGDHVGQVRRAQVPGHRRERQQHRGSGHARPGAVAHRPTNATPPRPRADRITAGSGRASGLCESSRMMTPIAASTRPPGIGGSASLGAGAVSGSAAVSSWPTPDPARSTAALPTARLSRSRLSTGGVAGSTPVGRRRPARGRPGSRPVDRLPTAAWIAAGPRDHAATAAPPTGSCKILPKRTVLAWNVTDSRTRAPAKLPYKCDITP